MVLACSNTNKLGAVQEFVNDPTAVTAFAKGTLTVVDTGQGEVVSSSKSREELCVEGVKTFLALGIQIRDEPLDGK